MSSTKIIHCKCIHNFQDKQYGKGNRVHNMTKDDGYRCTVCKDKKGEKITK